MKMHLTLVVATLLVIASFGSQGQTSAQRGVAGAAAAVSDWADRQSAINAEIALAKAKADIEVETHRRKLADERAAAVAKNSLAAEEAVIAQLHPQWRAIVQSNIFRSWMETRPAEYQKTCRTTQLASVMAKCIDDMFTATVVQVK